MEMTRKQFEESTLEEIMEVLQDHDLVTNYDTLKDFAKEKVDEDMLFLAVHILNALNDCWADYYIYDYCMGTLDTPTAIESKDDVEHLFDFDD